MPELLVVIGSTRPGRVGASVAEWFVRVAERHAGFAVTIADLKELGLPLLDEAAHPMLQRYEHDHTRRWSDLVRAADAAVFVIPEYNHSFNAATKNAIDYLHAEWQDKAVGFVSYGGVSGGTRAAQALRPVLLAVKAVPAHESVTIPFVHALVDSEGFRAPDGLDGAAETMLDELLRRDQALAPLRATTTVHHA